MNAFPPSPINHPKTPVNRTSPSNGYNPSTEPRQALKSPRFSCPLPSDICDLRPAYHISPPSIPHLRTQLTTFHPKYPVFQHFLAHKKCFSEDLRDQKCVFARLSCIEKGFGKNMARILGGVRGSLALRTGGGVGCLVVSVPVWPCVCVPVALWPCVSSSALPPVGHFWPCSRGGFSEPANGNF